LRHLRRYRFGEYGGSRRTTIVTAAAVRRTAASGDGYGIPSFACVARRVPITRTSFLLISIVP
jgi:tetrahydromethanopterin S-methyltransferase subunit C